MKIWGGFYVDLAAAGALKDVVAEEVVESFQRGEGNIVSETAKPLLPGLQKRTVFNTTKLFETTSQKMRA